MRDDSHDNPGPGVDFVVAEDEHGARDSSEELGEGDPKPASPLRRNLLLGAAVLVVFALIARGATSNHDKHVSASPSASDPVPTAVPSSAGSGLQILNGSGTGSAPADVKVPGGSGGCPVHATCNRVTWLPDATMTALELAFPHVVIDSASSLLTVDPSGLGHGDLVQRSIIAADGNNAIAVTMQTYHAGDPSGGRIWIAGERATSYWTGQAGGCTITVAVSRPNGAGPQSRTTLEQLANDSDLAAPR